MHTSISYVSDYRRGVPDASAKSANMHDRERKWIAGKPHLVKAASNDGYVTDYPRHESDKCGEASMRREEPLPQCHLVVALKEDNISRVTAGALARNGVWEAVRVFA